MISKLPLIGEIPNSNKASVAAAFRETAYSTVFSTVPIWFFPLFAAIFFSTGTTFWASMYATVAEGDLFIYSSSLVGPLIFAITANYAQWDAEEVSPSASRIGKLTVSFPYGTWFFIISLVVCTTAGMCFGLMRFSKIGAISAKLNVDNLFWFSAVMYAFSILCLFCVSVYRNEMSSGKFGSDSTRDFVEAWKKRDG